MTNHDHTLVKSKYGYGGWEREENLRCDTPLCNHTYYVHSIRGGNCHVTKCECQEFRVKGEVDSSGNL